METSLPWTSHTCAMPIDYAFIIVAQDSGFVWRSSKSLSVVDLVQKKCKKEKHYEPHLCFSLM